MTGLVVSDPSPASPSSAVAPWSGGASAAAIDVAGAVARLPLDDSRDPFERMAAAFLAGYPPNSARAYRSDLLAWAQWCADAGVHPFDARRHHVDAWVRALSSSDNPKTLSPATIRRRMSAVSKFYRYGDEVEVLTYNPFEGARRPKASTETASIGLSPAELTALIVAAEAHSPRWAALVTLLAHNGLRIDEALATNVTDYTYQAGHRVLRITRKGGKRSIQPLAAPAVRAIDAYLGLDEHPADGPLFLDRTFTNRLPYRTALDQIQRLAKVAKIPAADQLTPHSLRHTFVTEALAAGVPLQDVQDAAGHQDPATTRRYDRSRLSHDRHPTYAVVAHLQRTGDATGGPISDRDC
ncbi:site-specific tyrosine recombinase XerD [Terrabacter aeriphilus]|uniref:Site-specific tyrosine recombinase XerD n=1 Tax=Terrabacter aeriphilus TaxID=515662 RepID=A0ABP9JQG6_9MICO